jgi:LDH2 family malate/lactate/ureidoglycolate dehydrogenase
LIDRTRVGSAEVDTKSMTASKLSFAGGRTPVPIDRVRQLIEAVLAQKGCAADICRHVAEHLIDTELCGVESHGVARILQYAEQYDTGYLRADANPRIVSVAGKGLVADGDGGIGIPAMAMAVDRCCKDARTAGISMLPLRNVGHTGRLGTFAENGATGGCFVLIVGGGGRQNWRQVAPYGGRKAILPTNPYCLAIPGGRQGPVVVDFATSMIAGGWLYAARAAKGLVPEGTIIDRDGRPSRDPEAYFGGGAILPKGGAMGYGLAIMAEMLCEAMLGPVQTEVNWLIIAIDTSKFRPPAAMQAVAEEILSEVRECPPADGFSQVEVPGERERARRKSHSTGTMDLPDHTWRAMCSLAEKSGRSSA